MGGNTFYSRVDRIPRNRAAAQWGDTYDDVRPMFVNIVNDIALYVGGSMVERVDNLLLFMITPTTTYLIDIKSHKKQDVFLEQAILAIVERNWLELHFALNKVTRSLVERFLPIIVSFEHTSPIGICTIGKK